MRQTPQADTRTRTSPGPGCGSGRCTALSDPGSPDHPRAHGFTLVVGADCGYPGSRGEIRRRKHAHRAARDGREPRSWRGEARGGAADRQRGHAVRGRALGRRHDDRGAAAHRPQTIGEAARPRAPVRLRQGALRLLAARRRIDLRGGCAVLDLPGRAHAAGRARGAAERARRADRAGGRGRDRGRVARAGHPAGPRGTRGGAARPAHLPAPQRRPDRDHRAVRGQRRDHRPGSSRSRASG